MSIFFKKGILGIKSGGNKNKRQNKTYILLVCYNMVEGIGFEPM